MSILHQPASVIPPPVARERSRPIRYLILRAHPSPSRSDFYNCQELGLATELRRQGIDAAVAGVFDDDVRQLDPGLRIHQLRFRPRHTAFALISNLEALGLEDYDVIQLTDLCLSGNMQVMLRAPRRPRILLYQGHYPEPLGRARWLRIMQSRIAARALKRRPHAVLAKNAAAAKFLEHCGLGSAPVAGVGLVSENLLAPQPPPREVQEFVQRSPFTFLYVGHLSERRPLHWVMRHLQHPALQHASLLVVGGGPQLERVREQGAELICDGRMLVSGHLNQSQLGALYRQVHALVLPTRFEIFGMVCLEAVLFGLPLIASDAAGPAVVAARFPGRVELVPHGENPEGWLQALSAVAHRGVKASAPAPNSELVRALSWEVPARYFVRAAEQLLAPAAAGAVGGRGLRG